MCTRRSPCTFGQGRCPLTENGFLRIFGNPNYPAGPGSTEEARRLLRSFQAAPGYRFWPDDLSLADLLVIASLPPEPPTDRLLPPRSGCGQRWSFRYFRPQYSRQLGERREGCASRSGIGGLNASKYPSRLKIHFLQKVLFERWSS